MLNRTKVEKNKQTKKKNNKKKKNTHTERASELKFQSKF